MKKQKTTIHEIAKALNTTAATVSRALNDNPRISEEMREKVLKTAEEMGYEPNSMASALRRGTSKIIGIIVPYADRIFFSSVIRGIEEELKKSGYNVIICQSYEKLQNEIDDVNALLAAQVAGIIISMSRETSNLDHLTKITKHGKPLILFDRTTDELPASSVAIDDFKGAYMATKHLLDNGYKRIAFFSGNKKISIFRERYRGYKTALNDNNIQVINEHVIEVRSDVELGKEVTEQLMCSSKKPDAILSSSDFTALGAAQWLIENGYNIPQDIGIVGFGNDPFTQYLTPTMTSVDQKTQEMGRTVAQVLLEEISNNNTSIQRKILLSPELVIRKSSKRVSIEELAI